jgi:iron-sulfur cluster repair protein YtfE (RIC family)
MAQQTKTIEKDITVAEVLRNFPRTISVFSRYGIAACCCGQQSIEASASERNIDLAQFLDALRRSC